jgi:hypothetical protein
MSFDYQDMQDTAAELLGVGEFGKVFTLNRYDGGTTLADGSDSQGSASPLSVTGVSVPFSQAQTNSSTIEAGDVQLIIDATLEPLPADKLVIDGAEYSIISIERKKPADVVLCYFIQLRK